MNKKATEKNNILTIGELAEVSGMRIQEYPDGNSEGIRTLNR